MRFERARKLDSKNKVRPGGVACGMRESSSRESSFFLISGRSEMTEYKVDDI